jgi:hypothetical protein
MFSDAPQAWRELKADIGGENHTWYNLEWHLGMAGYWTQTCSFSIGGKKNLMEEEEERDSGDRGVS